MKKLLLVFLLCLSLLLLPACSKKEPVYEVEYSGKTYVVDTVNQTIQDDDFTYSYEISHGRTGITIEYPDGSTYWWQKNGSVSYGGWSNDHDPSKYPTDGTVLIEVLEQEAPKQRSEKNIFPFFLLLILGLFNLLAPEASWYLSYGWRYKNAEPSDAALVMARVSGGMVIAAAILLLIV